MKNFTTFSSAKLIGKKLSIVNCTLLIVFCLFFGGKAWADNLTVHNGSTTNGYVPVYGYYADAYLKCEFVYPASELSAMTGGTISAMKFYASQSSVSWGNANFQVFLKEVNDATISAFAGPGTVVYEGALSISGSEMNVTFTTPFSYNGGNLLVGVYNTVEGDYVTSTWYGETVTSAAVYGYSYSGLSSVSPTSQNFLPKTTFTYTPISVPTASPTINQNTSNPSCNGDVTLEASGEVPSGFSYHWYSNQDCTNEITSGVSGTNNKLLVISPSSGVHQVYCRLERSFGEQVKNFEYNGGVQTYTAPSNPSRVVSLQMEVWGAQGGGSGTYEGGKGGYAKGKFVAQGGQTFYICVGGAGVHQLNKSSSAPGGYNGGGEAHTGSNNRGSSGGGCSHIATMNGTLAEIGEANSSSVLLVAGGGGGGKNATRINNNVHSSGDKKGGCGGGDCGGDGLSGTEHSTGGTQNAGGNSYVGDDPDASEIGLIEAGFGYGAFSSNNWQINAGGGGWYGGGLGRNGSGAGGSGYVNTSLLSETNLIAGNASMPNPAGGTMTGRSDNGYARITETIKVVGPAAQKNVNMLGTPLLTSISAPEAVCAGGSITIISPEINENGSAVTSTGWEIANSENGTYTGVSQIGSDAAGKYVRFVATNGCGSAHSNAVQIASIKQCPTLSSLTGAGTVNCDDYVSLSVTPSSGNIGWYSDENCTNELSSANVLSLGKLIENATYYAKASEVNELESLEVFGSQDFVYTGSVQTYDIPEGTAAVKLEVWGAQGGNYTGYTNGGAGGYSVGMWNSPSGTLYICVGGQGAEGNATGGTHEGGYNGGGASYQYGGAGGGATHIATASGVLSSLSGNTSEVLIVAGGGGGGGYQSYTGGTGGGTSGGAAQTATNAGGAGGTQSAGGSGYTSGSFGTGAALTSSGGGGGGSGWYGGGSGRSGSKDSGGGGGSGHVNTSLLESGAQMVAGNRSFIAPAGGFETGHTGNGYARITLYRHKTITCASSVQTAQITVTPMSAPTVQDITICEGTTGQLNVQSPLGNDITYRWNNSASTTISNTYTTDILNEIRDYNYTVVAYKNVPDNPNNIVRSYNFDYTGDVQEVVAPDGAEYAVLEVWGAQGGEGWGNGGNAHSYGGKGGYARGKMSVSAGQHLYVVVGGKGSNYVLGNGTAVLNASGGYNGGGSGSCDKDAASDAGREASGAGGGATHIATASGLLSSLSGNTSAVLLVAGGGGGGSFAYDGGYGGGLEGGQGNHNGGYGGTQSPQSSSGTQHAGTFGQGAEHAGDGNGDGIAGGGGGYYGGNANSGTSGDPNAGGGGSGYVNSTLTESDNIAGNTNMPNPTGGTMTGKEGNGYARIVFYGSSNAPGSCASVEKTVTVTVNQKPEAPEQISANQSAICNGSSITLTASGGRDGTSCRYEWGIGETVGTNAIEGSASSIAVSPSYTTKYWVRKVGTSACKNPTGGIVLSSPVTVNSIVPNITGATTICSSGATLTATGGSEYKWTGSSNFSATPTKDITEAGTYTVTVKSGNCTASTSRKVTLKETPTVSMNTYATPVDCGTLVTLSASSGQTISWYSDSDCTASASPTFTPTADAVTRYAKVSTDYTGIIDTINYDTPGMYEFTVPSDVDYVILETWGAQGGASKANGATNDFGGKGGYAKGKLSSVSAGDHLYVVVGGKGGDAVLGNGNIAITATGGYNGGGGGTCDNEATSVAGREASGAGGGATHIATAAPTSGDYQLRYYSSTADRAKILLVAGGGGGASYTASGGCGGGTAAGASATAGTVFSGGFGYGAHANGMGDNDGVAGGGGGWLGGNSCSTTNHTPSFAGGGTGYVNESSLTDIVLTPGDASMPNPAGGDDITGRIGNGYARIIVHRSNALTCASTASATVAVRPASVVLSEIQDTNICAGTTVNLKASTTSIYGSPSYSWTAASGLSSSGANATISAAGTYTYNVTATLNSNAACTATDSKTVEVSYKTPASAPAGIANGDYVWAGGSTQNWSTPSNWFVYSTVGGGTYNLATSQVPQTGTNVFIADYTCLGGADSKMPKLNETTANVNNLTICANAKLNDNSKTLNVYGYWTNNGSYTATGKVVFMGTEGAQTIGGSNATNFNNIEFSNANGISISKEPTIDGTATFSRGVVTGDVTFGTSATAGTASRTSHVDGKVTKEAGSSEFTFPTGNAGVLGSVTATVTSDTWVRFHNLVASGDDLPADYPRFWNPNNNCDDNNPRLDHVSNFEYWDISSPAGLSGATIVASADNADKHFGSTEPAPTASNVFGAIWTGSCWSNIGGSNQTISLDNKTITITGVDIPAVTRAGMPYFTLGSKDHETLLPIELVSFTAQCDGRSSLVEWTTATEKNNDYFSLERSDDAINFTEIARVAGSGNSIEPIDYSYTDYGIHGGDNYYRLVQVDYDGTRTVSEIVVANCIEPEVGEPDVQAYPNPFNDELTVVLDNFGNRAATIEVYDMLGKLIYTNKIAAPQNSYETILNLSNLPPAAYTVRVSTNDFVINKNVVKQ